MSNDKFYFCAILCWMILLNFVIPNTINTLEKQIYHNTQGCGLGILCLERGSMLVNIQEFVKKIMGDDWISNNCNTFEIFKFLCIIGSVRKLGLHPINSLLWIWFIFFFLWIRITQCKYMSFIPFVKSLLSNCPHCYPNKTVDSFCK